MNSHRQTKRARLTSGMALVMCVVMLLGTTFAWFTDTARTSVNKIEAGNLDVELYYGNTADGADGTVWGKLDNNSPALKFIQSNGTTATQQDFYWEPGGTYSLPALKVVNNGNLNLKYKIEITGIKGSATLNDVIDWTMELDDADFAIGSEHVLKAATAGTESANILTISGHMRETAGNTYMNEKIEGITITLKATQAIGEYDSTRNDYDENATYPDVAFVTVAAPTAEETAAGVNPLANALKAASAETNADGSAKEKITADLGAGTFTLTDKEGESKAATAGKEITLAGAGKENTTFTAEKTGDAHGEANGTYCFDGAKSVVLKDMTVKFDNNKDYQGFVRAGVIRFENCTIIGKQVLNANEAEFINCVFENSNDYCVWTYGSPNVTFTNCEFKTGGKAILIYNEYTDKNFLATVKVKQCSFNDDGTLTEKNGSDLLKAAIETGTNGGNTATSNRYIIEVEGTTVTGFAINTNGTNTKSTLWANKNSMDADHLTVTIDGVKVQ